MAQKGGLVRVQMSDFLVYKDLGFVGLVNSCIRTSQSCGLR